ncbi:ABC transporter permease [Puniceicoccaceae bacterium K14]|nr:ABC transporter permease [Puniceicoccaceae bacterium K14]
MIRFILIRLLQAIPVLLIISVVTFAMVRTAPGGPFDQEVKMQDEVKAAIEAHYGLDKSAIEQYFVWLGNALQGDLGPSFKYPNRSVHELIGDAFPVSLELGIWAMLVALTLGVGAGLIASTRPNTSRDYLPMSIAMFGICIPRFVMGPLLILVFSIYLQWYNSSGWFFASDRVLPALTMGIYYAAYVARLTRGGMLEVLGQDYIRTARAKGADEKRIIFKHAFKGGMRPVVSFFGPAMANLLAGSFIVESIFQIPGLGRYFIMAAFNRDYFLIQGTVMTYAVLIIVLNLLADILLVWLSPRLRFD